MAKHEYWLTEEGLMLLSAWARDGLIEEQIAHNMGISLTTLKTYKQKYPTILTALKKGKEIADIQVENALFKRAVGYTRKVIKPFMFKGEIVIAEYLEEVAPDATAAIYWLKNRKPEEWLNAEKYIKGIGTEPEELEDISESEKEIFGDD